MTTIDQFKARNVAAGQHFFDYEAIQFFNSFIYPDVIYNTLFVTSEQRPGSDEPRLFTIRRAVNGGERIETVGDFQQYETLEGAKLAAMTLQSCTECGIDLFDGEAHWRNQEHGDREYPGSGGDPYCEEHAASQPAFYRSPR